MPLAEYKLNETEKYLFRPRGDFNIQICSIGFYKIPTRSKVRRFKIRNDINIYLTLAVEQRCCNFVVKRLGKTVWFYLSTRFHEYSQQ